MTVQAHRAGGDIAPIQSRSVPGMMLMISATLWPFITGKDPVFILPKAGWASEPLWTCTENIAPPRFDPRIRPALSKSLYRPRYPSRFRHPKYGGKIFPFHSANGRSAFVKDVGNFVLKGMTSLPRRQYYL